MSIWCALLMALGLGSDVLDSPAQLAVSAKILRQETCRTASGMEVKFFLNVELRNVGSRPLISMRGPLSVLSAKVNAPGVGTFEVPLDHPLVFPEETFKDPSRGAKAPQSRDFLTIPVQGKATLSTVVDMPWFAEFGASGEVRLSFELQTWRNSLEVGHELRKRWSQHGWLWVESATSEPVVWNVPPAPATPCQP